MDNEQQSNAAVLNADLKTLRETAGHLAAGFEGQGRAFVQVQTGCDNDCSFCAVPTLRGPNRSVPVEQIVDHVKALVEAGHVEVVLVGANVAGYGTDLDLGDGGLSQIGRASCRERVSAPV